MRCNKKEMKRWLAVVACCIAVALAGCNHQAGFYVEQGEGTGNSESENDSAKNGADSLESSATNQGADSLESSATNQEESISTQEMIYVQVSGAVVSPGVYQMPEGSRVFEAVELAGGMTEEADINAVNQAQALSDGQMIYIYGIGEPRDLGDVMSGQTGNEQQDGRVNLNTATAEELMTLPGIGQSKADMIISYREEYGAYECVEDIMNIQGIKEGVFSKIKDQIKVN